MLDERFTLERFLALGLDTRKAQELCTCLEGEIQMALHQVILAQFEKIREKLKVLGHDLKYYKEPVPGEIESRDDVSDQRGYQCRLRVAVDCIISVGFAHLRDRRPVQKPGPHPNPPGESGDLKPREEKR